MNQKMKLLMTKKELELIESGSAAGVKFHSVARLKDYIKLARRRRDKYRDLTQRQNVGGKNSLGLRTAKKAKIFASLVGRYEKRLEVAQSVS
jgi:hypothetical protein